jgi:hypothetical protein
MVSNGDLESEGSYEIEQRVEHVYYDDVRR